MSEGRSETDINAPVLECRGLVKNFRQGDKTVEVLRGIDFTVAAGETVAIVGASGSGKTTLLQLLGGLDAPSSGTVSIAGRNMTELNDAEKGDLRNAAVGFVYQFHHLLPEFSALENVAMPLLIRRQAPDEARSTARELLQRVGLGERLDHRPGALSGGERQRAAVARALVTRPRILLADEPTGNLDGRTGERVFSLLLELNQESMTSLVLVTHDLTIARRMGRIMTLRDGRLHEGLSE
ncbi:MAG: lipoprotein-releasing ABC transporter ATP-binding protein LolD [Gammaproteobacteria bacterium]|nr:lipoprotein-releasing ABC transporter ATP-binding protein LolD [Gammaproteobacteria bacterium]